MPAPDHSVFMDKGQKPDPDLLNRKLGRTSSFWIQIKEFTIGCYPGAIEEWNFSGEKYGWSFRIKDKKRAIIYLLPRDGYFKVAFVFGQKAANQVLASKVSEPIKQELNSARVYAEGRGIRIEVKDEMILSDIFELIRIKISL